MLTKTLALLATVALGASSALAQTQPLTIDTPTDVRQCTTTVFTWSGGQSPFFLVRLALSPSLNSSLIDMPVSIRRNGVPLETSKNTLGSNAYFWLVDVTAGSEMQLLLTDAASGVAQSAPFRIAPGFNNCTLQPGF
ncbi:hypothetical protein OH77DRAFT_1519893 [Trametes cingulata]|nr:hypothetical protein OH77DRAFT_1519893 [Trametes cingulata]